MDVPPNNKYLPVAITRNPYDSNVASSAHALTLLQLIANVDMAGAVLPPELVTKLLLLGNKKKQKETTTTTTPSLDQVTLTLVPQQKQNKENDASSSSNIEWTLTIASESSVTIQPSIDNVLDSIWHEGYDESLVAFVCIALALRYKAPMILQLPSNNDKDNSEENDSLLSLEELQDQFPLATPIASLQRASNRVADNIERSFRVHQLQAALRLAQEKSDIPAMERIRAALDDLDGFQELPTQAESDTDSMQ